jgi:hypothetical protein
MRTKYARLTSVALASAALLGCDPGSPTRALGDFNTIVVLVTDSLWAEVGDSLSAALEPRVFTTRNERTFEVEQMSPLDPRWEQLRGFVQVLSIGVPGDGWISPVTGTDAVQPPTIVQRSDVWTRGQLVTALVVSPGNAAGDVLALADSLGRTYDSLFRRYVGQRMFASGPNTELRDSLVARYGFGITIPNVYNPVAADDSVRVFRSDAQIGGTLFRSVAIARRDGVHAADAQSALDWRDQLAAVYYTRPPQTTTRDTLITGTLPDGGVEVQGIWESADTSFPEAGVFITRMIPCPDRNQTYLLDAWLLAPGRNKVEYMIQFQTILDSFACSGAQS